MEIRGRWEITGHGRDAFARCCGEGSLWARAAPVVSARPEHCRHSALYSQPASPSCTKRDGRTRLFHFFFPSLEVDSDTAYKIEWWCVLRPPW